MSSNEFIANPSPKPELRKYADGHIDEIYKTPGDRFSTAELVRSFQLDPVLMDIGSVLVQTLDPNGNRQKYFFDHAHFVDSKNLEGAKEASKFLSEDPANAITVGEPWQSPHGLTQPVEAVAIPYIKGYHNDMVVAQPANFRSQTAQGRLVLDELV